MDVTELAPLRCHQAANAFDCVTNDSTHQTRLHTGAFWCLQQPKSGTAEVFNHSIARGHGHMAFNTALNTADNSQLGMCDKSAASLASASRRFAMSGDCHWLGGRTAVVGMPPWHVYHFYAEFAFALYSLMHASPHPDHVVLFTNAHGGKSNASPNATAIATARYRSLWEHDSSRRRVLFGLLQLLGPQRASPDVLVAGTVLPSPRVTHVIRDVCMERASFGMRASTQLMFSNCQPFWLSTPGPSGSCAGFGTGRCDVHAHVRVHARVHTRLHTRLHSMPIPHD